MNEDDQNWKDSRLIQPDVLKDLDKGLIRPTKEPATKERQGNPSTDGENPYTDGGCPR